MADLPVLAPAAGYGQFAGVNRRIDVPAPAAGAEWSLTLPGGSWWRLLLGRSRLVTAVAVANRDPGIELLDPDNQVWAAVTSTVIAASLTTTVSYASGSGAATAGVAGALVAVPMTDAFLPPGYVLRSFTPSLQAADQYDQVRLWMQELDLGPLGATLGRPDEYLPTLISPEGI